MSRLIDADDVKKRGDCYPPEVRSVISNILRHTKTIKDVVPVVHGKLIYKGVNWDNVHVGDTWECSKCHKVWFSDSGCDILYCSNCGARLDEVSE